MARGTVGGETPVSQAATDDYRAEHDRIFGERTPGQRGRWIWDAQAGKLVRAEDYRPPDLAVNAPIIADRIHEGATFDDGTRTVDIGSRAKRREFMRSTGLVETSDVSRGWLEKQRQHRERDADRRTDAAFDAAARRLHNAGRLKD